MGCACSGDRLTQAKGTKRTWEVQITDDDGNPVFFALEDARAAFLWDGTDGHPIDAALTTAWVDPTQGILSVTSLPSNVRDLSPGLHRLRVTVLGPSDRLWAAELWLHLLEGPACPQTNHS